MSRQWQEEAHGSAGSSEKKMKVTGSGQGLWPGAELPSFDGCI